MNEIDVSMSNFRKLIMCVVLICINVFSIATAIGEESSFVENIQAKKETDFRLSAAEHKTYMREISSYCAGIVEKAADKIIALSDDRTVKRNALIWKMTSIPVIYETFSYKKPIFAGIDGWALCLQMKHYFESEDSQKAYGELNRIGFEAASQMESKVVELAKLMSRNGEISNPETFIEAWAKDNPIQMPLYVRTSIIPLLSSGIGEETLGTFEAVGELSSQVDDITDMLTIYGNHLPKQSRWQVEKLLSDLGTAESISILLTDLGIMTEVLQRVGTVFELLPGLIVDERTAILDAIRNERKIVLEALDSERREVMSDIKLIEHDMLLNAIEIINQSVDHFFWRAVQLIGACLVLFFTVEFIGIYLFIKKR